LDYWFNLENEQGTGNVFVVKIDGLEDQKIENFQSKAVASVFLNPQRSLSLFLEKTRTRLAVQYGFLKRL